MGTSDMEHAELGDVIEDVIPVGEEEAIYVAHHDVRENGLTVTLSLALAEVTELEPTDIVPKFAEHVDPDALDRMFRPLPNGDLRKGGPLHLSIEGFDVEIHNTGRIEIRG